MSPCLLTAFPPLLLDFAEASDRGLTIIYGTLPSIFSRQKEEIFSAA